MARYDGSPFLGGRLSALILRIAGKQGTARAGAIRVHIRPTADYRPSEGLSPGAGKN